MKIVLNAESYGYSKKAILAWNNNGYKYVASSWDEIYSKPFWQEVDILIVRLAQKIDAGVLVKFPNLTKVITATTGLDHIDLATLKERNIKLISLRGQDNFLKTIPSTAEHTWALLLSLIRNIPSANEHVKSGDWNRDLYRGFQLKNKIIGIIGFGRTGQTVAKYAQAFDMKVIYYDPYVNLVPELKVDSIDQLMKLSDILTFHIHLNEETLNILDAKNIQNIKSECFLINTSRGKIWDEEIVAEKILNKRILGVASDVLSTELDDITKSPLWQAQQKGYNVIITPHIGGATWDAMWACEEYITNSFL